MSSKLEQLHDFLKETPLDPFLHYALANEYQKLGNEEEALTRFVALTEQFPDYTGTYYHLGKLLEKLNRKEEAISYYEKGMAVAQSKRNMHALNELRGAYRLALGEEEDEDY
jgi:tetratricopeptide (TPR) repeat protein